MKRKTVIATVVLLAISVAAFGGRKDDFDFAQGLVELKYYDLAKEEFEKIISDTSRQDAERADGELGLGLLLKAQAVDARANPKATTDEVVSLFDAAQARLQKFLDANPNHPKKVDARFEVGLLLQSKGSFLSDRKEQEPERAAALSKSAEDALDQCTELFRSVAEALEERHDELPTAQQDSEAGIVLEWDAKRARFYEAVSYHSKGILYEKGSAPRRGTLEKGIQKLMDFVWVNEDNILGGYAYLYLGLSYREMDEPADCIDWLSTAFGGMVPDRKDDEAKYRLWTDLYLQAYFKLFEYMNELGPKDGPEYLETAEKYAVEMQERIPDSEQRKFGHFALMEYARTLMGLGKFEEAQAVATRVSVEGEKLATTTEWGAATAFMANRLLTEIIATAGASGYELRLPPDVLFKAASGKKTSQKWAQAVRAFQQVIRSCRSEEQVKAHAIPSWMEIGECYYRQEKFLEAYYAYDHLVKAYGSFDRQMAGDAAYYRYRAATANFSATKNPADEELKKQARSRFATEFSDHPRSIDLQYYEGADFIADGDALRSAAPDQATKAYEQALERLQGVKKTSILYEKALARMGEVEYRLGRYDLALKTFAGVQSHIDDPANVTTDPERKANRLQAQALSVYYASLCHKERSDWASVVSTLEGFETTFSDENVANFHAPVKFERLRAFVQMRKLAEAEKVALALREEAPDSPQVPPAFYLLGMSFDEASRNAPDRPADVETPGGPVWRENLSKAAEYVSFYVHGKEQATATDWETIGIWHYRLQDWPNSEGALEKALELYNVELDKLDQKSPAAKELMRKEDGITVMLSDILMRQGKFADARDKFEILLVPDRSNLPRVKELLLLTEFSEDSLKELMDKIRAVPSFMESLAKAYKELAQKEDMRRGIKLLMILKLADMSKRYTQEWWKWELLTWEIWLEYGLAFSDTTALENIVAQYNSLNGLGVLKNSPNPEAFTSIYQKANSELVRLGVTPGSRGK